MFILKPIEVSFTLSPQECYMHPESHKELAKYMFNKQYKNKCIARSYVVNVLDVIRVSPLYMIESDLEGRGQIHVLVLAECICYEKGMIIPNAKLIARNNNVLSFEAEYARITVSEITDKSNIYKSLEIGNVVPLEVSHTNYDTYYDENIIKVISCTGSIYTPASYSNSNVIKVSELTTSDVKYLSEVVKYQQDKLNSLSTKYDKKILKLLQDGLYTYKKPPKSSLNPRYKVKEKILKLMDFNTFPTYNNKKSVFVSKFNNIPRHVPEYTVLDIPKSSLNADNPETFILVVEMEAKDFLEYNIMDYFMFQSALIEMAVFYSNNNMYKNTSILWKYYNNVKI